MSTCVTYGMRVLRAAPSTSGRTRSWSACWRAARRPARWCTCWARRAPRWSRIRSWTRSGSSRRACSSRSSSPGTPTALPHLSAPSGSTLHCLPYFCSLPSPPPLQSALLSWRHSSSQLLTAQCTRSCYAFHSFSIFDHPPSMKLRFQALHSSLHALCTCFLLRACR